LSVPDSLDAVPWVVCADGLMLAVRVTPRASRGMIDGLWRDAEGQVWLGVRVAAAPADGAANESVISMLCIQLSLKKRDVSLVSGASARLKRFRLSGDPKQLAQRLTAAMESR